ncbi:hypothetical protein THYS13_24640 [Thermoanaerobacter sp. YS13]|uniref:hypothetical protein n=1 Tax=Thermoanaerobacter sp. YS13 TaxID=1511746 RepID=UPI0005733046|nr:hypothetical protein [Thermoanaerobacter sp. YS13]KHO60904.1 hypothetical protein THYS13_24640 [Thermoanaerobacter sp. YS13]
MELIVLKNEGLKQDIAVSNGIINSESQVQLDALGGIICVGPGVICLGFDFICTGGGMWCV